MSGGVTGWPDAQRRPPPHGAVLASGSGVTNPSVGPFKVGAYQALGIYCSKAATVTITWSLVGSSVTSTRVVTFDGVTKYQTIQNQGHVVDSIAITASSFNYYVTEANLPLPPSTAASGLSWAGAEGGATSSASPIIVTYNNQLRTNDTSLFTRDGSNYLLVHDYGLYLLWSTLVQNTAGLSDERFLNTQVDLGDGGGFQDALGSFTYVGASNVGSAEQFYPTGATWDQYNFGAENGLVEWPNDGANTPPFRIRLQVNRFYVGSITVDAFTMVVRIGSASP